MATSNSATSPLSASSAATSSPASNTVLSPTPTTISTSPTSTPAPPNTTSPSTTPLSTTPSSTTTSLTTVSQPTTAALSAAPKITTTPTTSATRAGVVTAISTKFVSNTGAIGPTTSSDASTSPKGFFANTGAVAGVFAVVGLIGLALIIALITNGIRRRRARKFDKELAAATLEAASAPKPIFLDDEEDDTYTRSGYAGGSGPNNYDNSGAMGGFSDVSSHGTYGQAPMSVGSHGQESYGMRELGGGGIGPGEIFDPYAAAGIAAAGAAGIGVARARSTRHPGDGGYAAALQEGSAPYAAFAAPTGQTGRSPNLDILEAAGMGAHVAGAGMLARNQSQSYNNQNYNSQYESYAQQQQLHQRSTSSEYSNLDRSKSMTSRDGSLATMPSSMPSSMPASNMQYYPSAADNYAPQYQQQGGASYQNQQQQYYSSQHKQHQQNYSIGGDDEDAYGGYVAEETAPQAADGAAAASGLPNPFERGTASSHGHAVGARQEYDERDRESSDDEDEAPRRVLKVANE